MLLDMKGKISFGNRIFCVAIKISLALFKTVPQLRDPQSSLILWELEGMSEGSVPTFDSVKMIPKKMVLL